MIYPVDSAIHVLNNRGQENFAIDHKWVIRKTSHKWKLQYFATLVNFHTEPLQLNVSHASLVSSKKSTDDREEKIIIVLTWGQ